MSSSAWALSATTLVLVPALITLDEMVRWVAAWM